MSEQHESDFDTALRQLESTANLFAVRLAKTAEVRAEYVLKIKEMSQSIRAAVEAGEMAADSGASLANQMRNEILGAARNYDMDLGRAYAKSLKETGVTLQEAIVKAMKKLGVEGQAFETLSGADQRRVLTQVIESAGQSRPKVTGMIPKLRFASRGLWLATVLIAAYNIGTADNPWWQSGREAANIGGGLLGSIGGGAAMGAAGGIWGGPVGVGVGVVVGGILGAVMADYVYVELTGTSDPTVRTFVQRFTGWGGVDEGGMAKALAAEYPTNLDFVRKVIAAMDHDYSTDADDVAFEYIQIVRSSPRLQTGLKTNKALRELLIKVLDEGWTDSDEKAAIRYVQAM